MIAPVFALFPRTQSESSVAIGHSMGSGVPASTSVVADARVNGPSMRPSPIRWTRIVLRGLRRASAAAHTESRLTGPWPAGGDPAWAAAENASNRLWIRTTLPAS